MSKKASEVSTSVIPAGAKTSLLDKDDELVLVDVPSDAKKSPARSRRSTRQNVVLSESSNEDEIRENLRARKFKVLERIFSNDENNESRCALYKVSNCLGQIAFVKVESSHRGNLRITRKDLTVVRIDEVVTIDESLKNGSYKCTGGDVNGVVLLGANTICMITHEKDPSKPKEQNFLYITQNHDREAILGDNPVAYPVVLYQEILTNAKMVNINIYEVTNRIRRAIHETSMHEFSDMSEGSDSIKMEIKSLNENFEKAARCSQDKLDKTIIHLQRLEEFQKFYVENPPEDDVECEKMQAISRLLCCWNEMIVDELKVIKAICMQREHIRKASQNIAKFQAYLETRYGQVMTEMTKVCPT